jgi:hypothetical protein
VNNLTYEALRLLSVAVEESCGDTRRISCVLEEINRTLDHSGDPPEWLLNGVAALVATIVGATVALLGSMLLGKRQEALQKDLLDQEATRLYDSSLDAALGHTIEAIGERIRHLVELLELSRTGVPVPAPLQAYELAATANIAWMIARGDDIRALKTMTEKLDEFAKSADVEDQLKNYRIVIQIVRAWRNGTQPRAVAIDRLAGLKA